MKGRGFVSDEAYKTVVTNIQILIYFLLTRFVAGILCFFPETNVFFAMFGDLRKINHFFFVYLAFYFVLSELIPTFLSMHSSFQLIGLDDISDSPIDESNRTAGVKEDVYLVKDLSIVEEKMVLAAEDYKLGTVYKAVYKGKSVCMREIKFERLTRYDVDNIRKDLLLLQFCFK